MRIIVCVKQVAHIYVQNGYDPNTGSIVNEGLVHIVNPYDEIAVEKALQLKEKAGGGHVAVVSLGPPRAEASIRWCLAMGADEGIHIVDPAEPVFDPWQTAQTLSEVIRQMPFDLLLFGEKAIDDELGQVGIFVADLLGLPVVTSATAIEITDSGRAIVKRVLERGNQEEVICPIPAVFTASKALSRPRYPSFPGRKSADQKIITKIQRASIMLEPKYPAMNLVKYASPKLRPKKILSPDSSMSAAARINFVISGGIGPKKGGTVEGNTGKIVSGIMDFLVEKKIIES